VKRWTAPLHRETGENPFVVVDSLQETMTKHVNIVRNREGLEAGLKELEALKPRVEGVKVHAASQYNPGWNQALDLRNMMITCEAVTRAGLMREESRGAHTREDFFEERDDPWGKVNIVVKKGADGAMVIEQVQRPAPPPELEKIAKASIEDVEAGKV
jgi:succinate dehydrogenase / fumarate reductase, flavoprotein subunit